MTNSYRNAASQFLAVSITLGAAFLQPAIADDAADDAADAIKAMMARKAAITAGRAKAQSCTRCHGRDGIHHLAVRAGWKESDGQFAMVHLRAFRDGTVAHVIMNAVASELNDEDIVHIAAWLDSLAEKR
jgi:cytochrome c553